MLPVLPMPQVFPVLLEIQYVRVELARPQARKLMNAFTTLQEQFSHVNPSQLSGKRQR